jgi:type IV secretory pathway VirB4 component
MDLTSERGQHTLLVEMVQSLTHKNPLALINFQATDSQLSADKIRYGIQSWISTLRFKNGIVRLIGNKSPDQSSTPVGHQGKSVIATQIGGKESRGWDKLDFRAGNG